MSMRSIVALGLACCLTGLAKTAVFAGPSPEAAMLSQEIAAKVPPDWQIHVTWREVQLVAFVTPPYQEAFDLWYEPAKLHAAMLRLCPERNDVLWARLGPDKQIAIQPTVGGKSGDTMRLVCVRR